MIDPRLAVGIALNHPIEYPHYWSDCLRCQVADLARYGPDRFNICVQCQCCSMTDADDTGEHPPLCMGGCSDVGPHEPFGHNTIRTLPGDGDGPDDDMGRQAREDPSMIGIATLSKEQVDAIESLREEGDLNCEDCGHTMEPLSITRDVRPREGCCCGRCRVGLWLVMAACDNTPETRACEDCIAEYGAEKCPSYGVQMGFGVPMADVVPDPVVTRGRYPREQDLGAHAAAMLEASYAARERPKCSRDDFADGFMAALRLFGPESSFKRARHETAAPPKGG